MMPVQFQIDLFEELRGLLGAFEPLVLSCVMQELTGLSQARGRDGAAARYGMTLGEKCTHVECGDLKSGSVDAKVIEYATLTKCMVVTNDRYIRDTLFEKGIGVISMRKQKKLEIMRS